MPNWCFNNLHVSGDAATIKEFKERVGRPITIKYETLTKGENGDWDRSVTTETKNKPVFSFMNVIAPTDMDAYAKQPERDGLDMSQPDWWQKHTEWASTQLDWYNWNNSNWGTKWDVAQQDDDDAEEMLYDESDTELSYRFDTAWAPPLPVIDRLSEMFPSLHMDFEYEEEQGWGGQVVFWNGARIMNLEYDSKCSSCDDIDCMTYCETCNENICTKCGAMTSFDCPDHKELVQGA